MEITVNNKIRIKNPPSEIREALIETLKVDNPKFHEAVNRGYSTYNLKPFIYNFEILPDDSLRIPRGYRAPLLEMVKDHQHIVVDQRSSFPFKNVDSLKINYRPYQFRAMNELITAGPEGFLVAPAGSGKTVVGLSLIPLLGQPCLWLTHTRPLANQAIERINEFLPSLGEDDIGFIGDGKWKQGNVITVAMIPTLVRRPTDLVVMKNDYGLVVLDEAHHAPASTFLKVVSSLNPYYLYGLTATPYRRDKLDPVMFQTLGPILVQIPVSEVEAEGGVIMPTVRYRTIRSKKIDHNNLQQILKTQIMRNDRRNEVIVGDVIREAMEGHYCIVLTDRKEHADRLFDLISIGWEKTGVATGKYSKKYVQEQAERLNNKDITVLVCTFALLGEGFDVKFLDRAFISMPFRAEGKVEQLVGRIQRSADGKKDAIVYDYVDADIGILQNQFFTQYKNDCRFKAYQRLGLDVVPFGD